MKTEKEILLDELYFYRNRAELRGRCDFCMAQKVLMALHSDGVQWICFSCDQKRKSTPIPDSASKPAEPKKSCHNCGRRSCATMAIACGEKVCQTWKPVAEKQDFDLVDKYESFDQILVEHNKRIKLLEQQSQANVTEERVHDIAREHVKSAFEAFRDGILKEST